MVANQFLYSFILRLEESNFFRLHSRFMEMHLCLLSDIDDCAVQPCQNGGNCVDAVNGYICYCVAGYSGKNCSVSEYKCYFLNYFV